MEAPGSSRTCSNMDERLRNEDDSQLSKASALRELEKARVRECQMEKTVRWWTVCTAGWRKKWSKLRQENDELRKQIKNYKTQINDLTQDCSTLNNRLEIFDAHNTYLKSEINKLLLKYGDENNERIQKILKTPEIVKQNTYICTKCHNNKDETKVTENTLSTPEAETAMFPESDEKFPLLDDPINESKNVEVLTEMISKIFAELQNLKGEFAKHNEGADLKELPEILMSADQITQLKLYTLSKQLEKEKTEKKALHMKFENTNVELMKLHNKIKEAKLEDFFLNDEPQLSIEDYD